MLTLADYRAEALATGSAQAGLRAAYAKLRAWDDPALLIALRPEEEAIAAARALTGRTDLPLFGVPFFVKDNIDVAGLPTTAACPEFAYTPEVSAFAVARLEAAGATAILISANSMYRVAETIEAAISVPLIHIIDETAHCAA